MAELSVMITKGDDSSGNFRRRVSVSGSPRRGAVRSLLADMRTSRSTARYGFAVHAWEKLRILGNPPRVAPTQPIVVDPQLVDGFDEDAALRVNSASSANGRDVANQERTAQTGPKRLRLTRLSQATTVVASLGGERATLQEMSHIQDTMEDIDAELDDGGPSVAAFDPRREPPDCVLAVTQRGSEGEGVEGPFLGVQSSVTVAQDASWVWLKLWTWRLRVDRHARNLQPVGKTPTASPACHAAGGWSSCLGPIWTFQTATRRESRESHTECRTSTGRALNRDWYATSKSFSRALSAGLCRQT